MPHTNTPWMLIKERGTGMQADLIRWIIRATKSPATPACKANPDLCYIFTVGGDIAGEAEGEANARLFLNSPALLNSLQETTAWMRLHTGPEDHGTREMVIRALAAIKAAGEEPKDTWE